MQSKYSGAFVNSSALSGFRGAVLVAALVGWVGYTLWMAYRPMLPDIEPWMSDIALASASGIAASACLAVAIVHRRSRFGLAWLCICIGMLSFTFGETTWAFEELVLQHEIGFPSLSDVGYLGAYPWVIAGLLLLPKASSTPIGTIRMMLDVAAGTIAVAALSTQFVISDLIHNSDLSTAGTVVTAAYPVADIVVIATALLLLGRTPNGWPRARILLVALAFVCQAGSDHLYTSLTNTGEYSSGGVIDIGWFTSYVLVSIAAVMSLGQWVTYSGEQTERPTPLWQSLAVYTAVIPLGALSVITGDTILTAATFTVMAIMYCRQLLASAENNYLNRQLTELNRILQIRMHEAKLQSMGALGGTGPIEVEPEEMPRAPYGQTAS